VQYWHRCGREPNLTGYAVAEKESGYVVAEMNVKIGYAETNGMIGCVQLVETKVTNGCLLAGLIGYVLAAMILIGYAERNAMTDLADHPVHHLRFGDL